MNGFVRKSYLVIGALDANLIMHAVILIGSAFLTAAHLLSIMIAAFFKKEKVETILSFKVM